MSREIKFRAKVADSDYENEKQSETIGSFVHFTGFIGSENDIGYVEQLEEIHGVGWFDVDLKTLGQYTGLKDKNGKEIFEGDIVKTHNQNNVIKYEHGSFLVKGLHADEYERTYSVLYHYLVDATIPDMPHSKFDGVTTTLEVIGNIYENPELLEATA